MGLWGRRKDNQAYPKNSKATTDANAGAQHGHTFNSIRGHSNHQTKKGETRQIAELHGREYLLVQSDWDVDDVKHNLGKIAKEYNGFIIKMGDGYYKEVWGLPSKIPHNTDYAHLIHTE